MIGRLKALTAGFILGILVAPRSGRASRQLLLERINEFFDMGTRRLEALEDELAYRATGEVPGDTGDWDEVDEPLAGDPLA